MKIKIAIADDHAMFRDGLKTILEKNEDWSVIIEASSGRELIKNVAVTKPDLILLDISMPELSGLTVLDMLKNIYPEIKVIMLSMHSSAEYAKFALDKGADGYVSKDCAAEEIITAINSVIEGKQYLSSSVKESLLEKFIMSPKTNQTEENSIASLSIREYEILKLTAEGKKSKEIASALQISPKTVDTYRCRLMKKLGLASRLDIVKYCINKKIIPERNAS